MKRTLSPMYTTAVLSLLKDILQREGTYMMMKDQVSKTLRQRVILLERRLQVFIFISVISVAIAVFLGGWVLITALSPGVVRVRAVEIVDETGRRIMGLDSRSTADAPYYIPHRQGTAYPLDGR